MRNRCVCTTRLCLDHDVALGSHLTHEAEHIDRLVVCNPLLHHVQGDERASPAHPGAAGQKKKDGSDTRISYKAKKKIRRAEYPKEGMNGQTGGRTEGRGTEEHSDQTTEQQTKGRITKEKERSNERTKGRTDGRTNSQESERMTKRIRKRKSEQTNGQTNERTNNRRSEQTHERTPIACNSKPTLNMQLSHICMYRHFDSHSKIHPSIFQILFVRRLKRSGNNRTATGLKGSTRQKKTTSKSLLFATQTEVFDNLQGRTRFVFVSTAQGTGGLLGQHTKN